MLRYIAVAALAVVLSCMPALADTRLALVIGNSAYRSVNPLPNPVNDAKAIAEDLKVASFDVTLANDLGQSDLRRAIRDFASKVASKGPDTIALVYYAGHGVQVDGENFLVPVDARIQRESDIAIEAVRLADLMNALAAVPSKMRIVILDACRNNPFAAGDHQTKGLAIVDAPTGSIVAYSTAPGTEATDGAGTNSPYTTAFLEVSREPHLQIEQVFKQVRLKVHEATKGQQTPWESSSLTSDFWFLPSNETPPAAIASAHQAVPQAMRVSTAQRQTVPSTSPSATPQDGQPASVTPPAGGQVASQMPNQVPSYPSNQVSNPNQVAAQSVGAPPTVQAQAPQQPQGAPGSFAARVAPLGPPPSPMPAGYAGGPPPTQMADMRLMSADDAYDYAIEEDTVDAYQQFLLIYSYDPRAEWIRTALALRVDAMAWRYAAVVNTPDAYAAYAAAYPGGAYVDDAVRLRMRPRLRPIDVVIAPRVIAAPPLVRVALPLIQMRRAPGTSIVLPVVFSRPGRFNERARFAPGPGVPGGNPAFAPRGNTFNGRANTFNNNAAIGPGPNGPQFRRQFQGNQPPVANVGPNLRGNVGPNGPHPPNPQFRPAFQRAQAGPGPHPGGPHPSGPHPPPKCEGKRCPR